MSRRYLAFALAAAALTGCTPAATPSAAEPVPTRTATAAPPVPATPPESALLPAGEFGDGWQADGDSEVATTGWLTNLEDLRDCPPMSAYPTVAARRQNFIRPRDAATVEVQTTAPGQGSAALGVLREAVVDCATRPVTEPTAAPGTYQTSWSVPRTGFAGDESILIVGTAVELRGAPPSAYGAPRAWAFVAVVRRGDTLAIVSVTYKSEGYAVSLAQRAVARLSAGQG